MPDLNTLDEIHAWRPAWTDELHPAFCGTGVGCDGHHLSEVAEVHTGGTGPWLKVLADMDRTGRCTVILGCDDDRGVNFEQKLTIGAAVALAHALLDAVHVARTQTRMVRRDVLAVAA